MTGIEPAWVTKMVNIANKIRYLSENWTIEWE